jgi:hypothetical protein
VIAWLYREAGFKDDSDALMTELAKLAASAASRVSRLSFDVEKSKG